MDFKTEQEKLWSGEFGDEYIERNKAPQILACDIALFSKALHCIPRLNSVIEFGANIGMNLKAISMLVPGINCAAVEINHKAADILKNDPFFESRINVYEDSIQCFRPREKYDLSLIKGVLIHINPDDLCDVYRKLYESTNKYICMAEYYNPSPVMIPYRGLDDKLYKRDFAGEFLDLFNDVRLLDYGFVYHRDTAFPQDDITWFMMEKI